ncbi:hypothetical protein M413DRAFT_270954 [Hebeloma cylindrosporum]|uniref:Uncharacterized protein n=1 Tax=Hebeloma cylindrosporum TaxID=76867 RepID=A0A0C3CTK2_HEBCY|nr:hypothetical protein M413DRAFT_270954 [Hebeloma cylindrosporum h7]
MRICCLSLRDIGEIIVEDVRARRECLGWVSYYGKSRRVLAHRTRILIMMELRREGHLEGIMKRSSFRENPMRRRRTLNWLSAKTFSLEGENGPDISFSSHTTLLNLTLVGEHGPTLFSDLEMTSSREAIWRLLYGSYKVRQWRGSPSYL